MTLWGSRFGSPPDPSLARFGDSFRLDRRLLPQDVAASAAWAEALEAAGVLTEGEKEAIASALATIGERAASDPSFLEGDFEDVHTFVEERLAERVGPVARKLHTGRSRNDQVATGLRLWVREETGRLLTAARRLRGALVGLARREGEIPMPGYTHLQRAQPILFGHFLLAHFERFGRDAERLRDAAARADACPLGSGALAGSPYQVDRAALAARLGFSRPTANSLDAVADRDFVVEILAALALCGAHLSQLGEDVVVFSSREFGFLTLDDAAATGSSLMPQKKNPDPAELLRARGAALAGPVVSMLAVLKGLPSGYNRDLQQDKALLFSAADEALECLEAAARIVGHLSARRERMERAAADPDIYATEIADHLVAHGLPFRDAHAAVGRAVRAAEERGVPLDGLAPEEWDAIYPGLGEDSKRLFFPQAALRRRSVTGGTAPERLREALAAAEAEIGGAAGGRHAAPGALPR